MVTLPGELLRRIQSRSRMRSSRCGPVGDARPPAGGHEGDATRPARSPSMVSTSMLMRCHEARRAGDHAHALALQQPRRARVQVGLDPFDACGQRFRVDRRRRLLQSHACRAAEEAQSPPVAIIVFDGMQSSRCAAPPIEVPLDDGDLRARRSGERSSRVSGRGAADDEQSCHHPLGRLRLGKIEAHAGQELPGYGGVTSAEVPERHPACVGDFLAT